MVSSENNYKDIIRRLDAVLAVLLESSSAEGKRIPMAKQVELCLLYTSDAADE